MSRGKSFNITHVTRIDHQWTQGGRVCLRLKVGSKTPWFKHLYFTRDIAQYLVRHLDPNQTPSGCSEETFESLYRRGLVRPYVEPPWVKHWTDHAIWLRKTAKNHLWELTKRGQVLAHALKLSLEETPTLFRETMV